jgi:hypothetical protein
MKVWVTLRSGVLVRADEDVKEPGVQLTFSSGTSCWRERMVLSLTATDVLKVTDDTTRELGTCQHTLN